MTLGDAMRRLDRIVADRRRELFTQLVEAGYDAADVDRLVADAFAADTIQAMKAHAIGELALAFERDRQEPDPGPTIVTARSRRTH